jgi:hypothetical protein
MTASPFTTLITVDQLRALPAARIVDCRFDLAAPARAALAFAEAAAAMARHAVALSAAVAHSARLDDAPVTSARGLATPQKPARPPGGAAAATDAGRGGITLPLLLAAMAVNIRSLRRRPSTRQPRRSLLAALAVTCVAASFWAHISDCMPHQTDCLPHQVRRRVVLGSGARRAAHAPDGTLIVSDCILMGTGYV